MVNMYKSAIGDTKYECLILNCFVYIVTTKSENTK